MENNFFFNQLKQVGQTQKNIMNFVSQNLNLALESSHNQQLTTLKSALDKSVETGHLNAQNAEKILSGFTQMYTNNKDFNSLVQENYSHISDQWLQGELINPQQMAQIYLDSLGKMNSFAMNAYHTQVRFVTDSLNAENVSASTQKNNSRKSKN